MTEAERRATEHMRTVDIHEAEPVRVERAYLAGWKAATERAAETVLRKTDRVFDVLHCSGDELANAIREERHE